MPKVNKIQSAFTSGEISQSVYGRVDNERYDQAMSLLMNYIPIVQGPLIRRPGTRYSSLSKISSQPEYLIPFQFSATQNYILGFGDKYVRFYTKEGQIVTSSNAWAVTGYYNLTRTNGGMRFQGIRPTPNAGLCEGVFSSSLVVAGSIMEVELPYAWSDLPNLKWTQKYDTLYLEHQQYPLAKLIRKGTNAWDFYQVILQDGPYLPLNSYASVGDSVQVSLNTFINPGATAQGSSSVRCVTYPAQPVDNITIVSSNYLTILAHNHNFQNGDKVCILGVTTIGGLNNVSDANVMVTNSSVGKEYYTVLNVVGSSSFDIQGGPFTNGPWVGSSGNIFPALMMLTDLGNGTASWQDIQVGSSNIISQPGNALRQFAFWTNGFRYWGQISQVTDAAHFWVNMGPLQQNLTNSSNVAIWQMGVFNLAQGFPQCGTFHQDRFGIAGASGAPQEVDLSVTANYETFAASGSTGQVLANNAIQFTLASEDLNAIKWIKSNPQGLIAGTAQDEFSIVGSVQNGALAPTSPPQITKVSSFGSYNADAIPVGNALLHIQRAQRRIRELLYFWQVGNFRSTNLSELAEHITLPAVTKLVSQRETHPIVWGLRSDGQLISMAYSRDDISIKAGWARHQLGGRFDSAGSAPRVNSIACIPSSDGTYDELWLSVQRWVNSSALSTIEYMTKAFDSITPQENSFYLDMGTSYDSPVAVTNLTVASSCVVTAPSHNIAASSTVRFYGCIGMNVIATDVNGIVSTSNPLNYQTFQVASVSPNAFKIQDFNGNDINTNSCSIYVGSCLVRALVTQVFGLSTWAGETVSVVADGGVHVNTSVTHAGVLNLQYPAAIVNIGYSYNSDAQMLRTKDGSAQGTSIGSFRRISRVAFMLSNVGDLSFGPSFTKLIPAEFYSADINNADTAPPLFNGIHREGFESEAGFTDTVCFRQSSGLPGMVQAVVRFVEEQDV